MIEPARSPTGRSTLLAAALTLALASCGAAAEEPESAETETAGEAPFDPEAGEGFSCFDCHARAEGG